MPGLGRIPGRADPVARRSDPLLQAAKSCQHWPGVPIQDELTLGREATSGNYQISWVKRARARFDTCSVTFDISSPRKAMRQTVSSSHRKQ